MQQKEILVKNKKVFYRSEGEGPAVVLVHGFAEDGGIWDRQWEALKNYHLIIPDLPGSGKSEMIDDMSMEGLAGCIENILRAENVSTCIMLGHSMGGYITLAFAERFALMLKGFGLVHSSSYADNNEKKETRKKGINFINENGPGVFLKTTILNLYGPITKTKNPGLINEHIASAEPFLKAALIAYYQSMIKRPDRTPVLIKTRLPVLLIFGKDDTNIPLHDGLQQTHLPMWSYVHILEESGHMGMKEEPEKFNFFITSYLSSIYRPLENE